MFLDLYGTLGKAKFLQGASELYAMSVVQPVGIAEVREAFGAEGGPAMAVIDHWYHGTES